MFLQDGIQRITWLTVEVFEMLFLKRRLHFIHEIPPYFI